MTSLVLPILFCHSTPLSTPVLTVTGATSRTLQSFFPDLTVLKAISIRNIEAEAESQGFKFFVLNSLQKAG